MKRMIKPGAILLSMVFILLIVGCKTTDVNLEIKSLNVISQDTLQVFFSDDTEVQITEFSPSPLVSGKQTTVTFEYDGVSYSQVVTWNSDISLTGLLATDSTSLRAQFSDGKVKRITDFEPKPLENGVETEVYFTYNDTKYYGVVTLNAPTVTNINVVDPVTIDVTFSNGSTKRITEFSPKPLENGIQKTISFDHLNVEYNVEVIWVAPELQSIEAINTLTLKATFDNGITETITDFTPKPLPYNQATSVTLNYYGVSYTSEVQLNLEEVNIDVSSNVIRQVNIGHILGGNMGAWVSSSKLTDQMAEYVIDTGAKVMRFPGGNLANSYCFELDLGYRNWDTGTPYEYDFTDYENRGQYNWTMDVHDFLTFIKKVDAVPMYSVNPFTHYVDEDDDGVSETEHDYVTEAVNLVKLFKAEGFTGAFYEIGNENMGSWNPMLTLDEYTNRFIKLAEAIRAEDPEAIILGPVTGASDREWFQGFVDRLVDRNKLDLLDYMTFHFYGNYNKGVELDHPQKIQPEIEFIRNLLNSNGGSDIKIAITEYNSALWGEELPTNVFTIDQALWTVDFTGQMLVNEVDLGNIWITLHPGSDPHTVIDDQTSKPSQNYWASYLVNQAFSNESGIVDVLEVSLTKASDEMTAYVVNKGNGEFGLVIINKESLNKQSILSIDGVTSGTLSSELFSSSEYNQNISPISTTAVWREGNIEVEVPAYSIVIININGYVKQYC